MNIVLIAMVFLPLVGAIIIADFAAEDDPRVARLTALVTVLATLVLAIIVTVGFRPHEAGIQMTTDVGWFGRIDGQGRGSVSFHLGIDGISLWLIGLTALLMVTAVLSSWASIVDRARDHYALLLGLETGMLGLFAAQDIILFYVFFEFTLIPLFFLIGIWGHAQRRKAAIKFFLYTLLGSLLTLLGLVYVVIAHYHRTSYLTFSIPELTANLHLAATTQFWVFLALFAGFAVKVPLFPLHTWLPLAHVEAPTAGSVILAGILLKVGTYGFLRFCLPLLPYASIYFVGLVATLAVIGIIYGALVALAQDDMKRLVAYSSVSHLGFCMLGLFALNAIGISGGLLQMVNHGLSSAALFAIVGFIYDRYHTREIAQFSGLWRRMPVMTFILMVVTLSSIGLPGLNGFVGEFLSLVGMYQSAPRLVGIANMSAPHGGAFWAIVSLLGLIALVWTAIAARRWLRPSSAAPEGPVLQAREGTGGRGPRYELAGLVVLWLVTIGLIAWGVAGRGYQFPVDRGEMYTAWAVLGIVLGAFYMLLWLQKTFFGPLREPPVHDRLDAEPASAAPPHGSTPIGDIRPHELGALVPLVVFMFWIGLAPNFFLSRMQPSLQPVLSRLDRAAGLAAPPVEQAARPGPAPARIAEAQPAE